MRQLSVSASLALVSLLVLAIGAAAAIAAGVDEAARSAAAVKAVDQHWLEAETHGDTAWLDGLLLPEYRSIGADGKVTGKAAIVAYAARNRDSGKVKREVAAWQAAHPLEQQVVLQGDAAVVSFVSTAPASKGRLYSSDVFVHVGGRWRALYSAHTGLGR